MGTKHSTQMAKSSWNGPQVYMDHSLSLSLCVAVYYIAHGVQHQPFSQLGDGIYI